MTEPSGSKDVNRASAASPDAPSPSKRTRPIADAVANDPLAVDLGVKRVARQVSHTLLRRAVHRDLIRPRRSRSPPRPRALWRRYGPRRSSRARAGRARFLQAGRPSTRPPCVPGRPRLLCRESRGAARHARRRPGHRRRRGHALQASVGSVGRRRRGRRGAPCRSETPRRLPRASGPSSPQRSWRSWRPAFHRRVLRARGP